MAKDTHHATASTKPSAKPGAAGPTNAKKDKKDNKPEKVLYPGLVDPNNPEGKLQLESIPTDWKEGKHKPLHMGDFKGEDLFWEFKAAQSMRDYERYKGNAEQSRKLGNLKGNVAAKKLMAMQRRMAELKAELSGSGVDVEALLATVAASMPAAQATTDGAEGAES